MMDGLFNLINRFFDYVWLPFSKTAPIFDLIILSAISAYVFLIIFKITSNQEKIKHYKNKIYAHILQIRLFKDYPRIISISVLKIFLYNGIYLRYAFIPVVFILFPVLIISIQINNRYGYQPIQEDQSFIISVKLDTELVEDIPGIIERIEYSTSKNVTIDTPPLRILSEATLYLRAKRISSGGNNSYFRIGIDDRNDSVQKLIIVKGQNQRFGREKVKWHIGSLFSDNAENFIPKDSLFKSIRINYERNYIKFIIWEFDPIVLYFILTLLIGFALKPIVKVNF